MQLFKISWIFILPILLVPICMNSYAIPTDFTLAVGIKFYYKHIGGNAHESYEITSEDASYWYVTGKDYSTSEETQYRVSKTSSNHVYASWQWLYYIDHWTWYSIGGWTGWIDPSSIVNETTLPFFFPVMVVDQFDITVPNGTYPIWLAQETGKSNPLKLYYSTTDGIVIKSISPYSGKTVELDAIPPAALTEFDVIRLGMLTVVLYCVILFRKKKS